MPAVRAPLTAEVLRVTLQPGEYVATQPDQSSMVLGETGRLHFRLDIDESEILRLNLTAPAVASPRGDPRQPFSIRCVRIEPYVVPKLNLTGASTERVDVRVMQAIYEVQPDDENVPENLYVGQQVDVFIEDTK